MSEPTLTPGWHFCAMRKGSPVLRDGTPLVIGQRYEHTGTLELCCYGYHDSVRVIDALQYAPGPYLCRTLASGDLRDTDKRVSRVRIAVAGADVTRELHDFAVRIAYCALLHERECGRDPDDRSWEALRVKQRWLRGDATDKELTAAKDAAWDAARAAASDAAWDAAKGAAWDAARAAALDAAWDAARAAASDAAWDAAKGAAWDATDQMLRAMLPALLRDAEVAAVEVWR